MNLLFVHTAFLGDLLLCIPAFKELKRHGFKLTLVCRSGIGDFFSALNLHSDHQKIFEDVFELKKNDSKSYSNLVQILNTKTWDIIICPHQSFRSTLFVKKIRSTKKIGFKSWNSFLAYDLTLKRPLELPEPLRILKLLEIIPINFEQRLNFIYSQQYQIPEEFSLLVYTSKKSESKSKNKKIAIFPGSVWATKRWTSQGFLDVSVQLNKLNYEVFFLGSSNEAELCESLAKQSNSQSLAGKLSLLESFDFIGECCLVLSNDSGGQHLAAAAGVPVITIFGPTTLDLGFRPWINDSNIIENKSLKCRPCGKHGHQQCPLGTHECMKSIDPTEVYTNIVQMIQK
jgi:heptosyltransferase-2